MDRRRIPTKILGPWRRLGGFYLLAALWAFVPAVQAADQDIFSVMGIELDVKARTAIAARERAIVQAEVRGFEALLNKLLDHDSPLLGRSYPAAQIRPMVRAFEVGEEKSASGRYIATYHVSYDPQSVRQFLGRRNAAFSEIPGDRLLVFPLIERHGATLLWEEENPWWQTVGPGLLKNYLHDYVVPEASFDERLAWSPGHLKRGPVPKRLESLLQKYEADDVLLINVRLIEAGDEDPPQALFEYKRLKTAKRVGVGRLFFLEGDDEGAVLGRVFAAIAERFDSGWKQRTRALYGGFKFLDVEAWVENVEAWVRMREQLEEAAMVRGIRIGELAVPISRLQIRYLGTEEQLRLTLEQVGLRLRNDEGIWRLSEPQTNPDVVSKRTDVGD
jgi:hypothetical protein